MNKFTDRAISYIKFDVIVKGVRTNDVRYYPSSPIPASALLVDGYTFDVTVKGTPLTVNVCRVGGSTAWMGKLAGEAKWNPMIAFRNMNIARVK